VEWNDEERLYPETMALRQKNPDLKILISVGGWTMNEPWSQYKDLFSRAVAPANRATFISLLFQFMDKWGFDG